MSEQLAATAAEPAIDPSTKVVASDGFLEVPQLGGGTKLIPVALAVKEIGELGAGRQLLEQAKEMRQAVHLDREHGERWRSLERQLGDPSLAPAALEGLKNMARARGVDVDSVIANATPNGTHHQPDPSAPARTGDTSQLDQRLRRIEDRENQTAFQRELDGLLGNYPGLTGKKRELVVESVLARATVQGDKPLQQIVNDVFNDYRHVRVDEPTPTQVRDARLAASQLPNVSPNVGTAQLAEIPAATGKSLEKGGTWASDTKAWLRQQMSAQERPH